MKTKFIQALVFLFFIGVFSTTLQNCITCGNLKIPKYFDVTDYILRLYVEPNGIIDVSSISFDIIANMNYYGNTPHSFNPNGNLWACSPKNHGYKGSKEVIKKFQITSPQNLNSDFPAGKSLNELFMVVDFDNELNVNYLDCSTGTGYGCNLESFLNVNPNLTAFKRIYLHFSKQKYPNFTVDVTKFTLFVDIEFDNGETYTMQTPEITMK